MLGTVLVIGLLNLKKASVAFKELALLVPNWFSVHIKSSGPPFLCIGLSKVLKETTGNPNLGMKRPETRLHTTD